MNKKKFKQVIIAGASTFYVKNLGDDAMLLNLVQSIKNYDKKIRIILLARHPNKKLDRLYGIKSIKNLEFDKRSASLGKYFFGLNSNDKTEHLDTIKKEFANSDMLILAGNLFMEIFPNSFLKGLGSYTSLLGILAKFYNLKIYMTSVNLLNHTKSELTRQYLKFFSDSVEKVCVRENNSFKNFTKLKFNSKKIKILGETAFGIEIKKNERLVKKICPELIKKKNHSFLGVCLRVEYWKKKDNFKNFFIKYAKILSKVALETKSKLVFVPNSFSKASRWMDDRIVHKKIIKLLDKKVKYVSINKELNIFEAYNIISKLNFHITNRRHSAVFALSQKIPTIIFETSMKGHLKPLVKKLNLNENLMDLRNNEKKIALKILRIWKNINVFNKAYKEKILPLKEAVKKEFSFLIN